jgi:hypothetical protein
VAYACGITDHFFNRSPRPSSKQTYTYTHSHTYHSACLLFCNSMFTHLRIPPPPLPHSQLSPLTCFHYIAGCRPDQGMPTTKPRGPSQRLDHFETLLDLWPLSDHSPLPLTLRSGALPPVDGTGLKTPSDPWRGPSTPGLGPSIARDPFRAAQTPRPRVPDPTYTP